jgi:hypothetical protein
VGPLDLTHALACCFRDCVSIQLPGVRAELLAGLGVALRGGLHTAPLYGAAVEGLWGSEESAAAWVGVSKGPTLAAHMCRLCATYPCHMFRLPLVWGFAHCAMQRSTPEAALFEDVGGCSTQAAQAFSELLAAVGPVLSGLASDASDVLSGEVDPTLCDDTPLTQVC